MSKLDIVDLQGTAELSNERMGKISGGAMTCKEAKAIASIYMQAAHLYAAGGAGFDAGLCAGTAIGLQQGSCPA